MKSFGETRAVDGVDLAVRSGSVYGVLGPNGAGKTTTIRMLATLLSPDGGCARVLGHDIVEEADAVRGVVSLTGQLASVDEDLTGRENLILLGRLLGLRRAAAKARAAELLEAFGLAEAAGKLVKNYSGGMRRRLDISASIVVTPQLMFLDEPTTGLDPRSRNQVWDIIRAMVGEGTTILLCTQYLEEADQLAEGIAVIDHGKVIAEGTPAQLKASVGSGALHVRLLDPEQRPEAEQMLARQLGSVHLEPDPAALSVGCADADRAAEAVAELARAGRADRRLLASASRASTRCSWRSPGAPPRSRPPSKASTIAGGAGSMSTSIPTPPAPAPLAEQTALRKALASTPRPPRASALSAALTFGWRGMLKVKHVPEQLLDVTITPVMFVLMFTYLFGGAIAGSTGEYLDYILPGMLVMSVLFTTVYSGVALNTDLTKGVVDRFRSLADLAARAARRRAARRQRPLRRGRHGDHRARASSLGFRPSARRGRRGRGARAGGRVRLRPLVGLHDARAAAALAQRGDERGLHGHLPADLPQQRVRRAGDAAGRARGVRRREPDLDPRDGLARADGGQRRRQRHRDRARRGRADTAVFAPLTTRLYRRG